jgi:hypothetical protein
MNIKLKNQTILIVANEPWGDVWFSKHNYAWELSKSNHVYFINSPEKWTIKNLFSNKIISKKIHETLTVISIKNYLPSNLIVLKEINNIINSIRLRQFVKNHSQKFILWSFTPLVFFRPKLIGAFLSIFHVVDMHWPKFYGTNILANNVDKLIIISNDILFEYEHVKKPKLIAPHGITSEVFSLEDSALEKVKKEMSIYGSFGLFVGSIDDRLDFDLIEKLAVKFPSINFVFIGPIRLDQFKEKERLFDGEYANIKSIGSRQYLELKYYIHLAQFCISPMNMSYPGNHISHHKTIPYLAQGKAIFSPYFTGYNQISDLMYMHNEHQNLIDLLDKFIHLGEDLSLKTKRIKVAQEHTYNTILKKIEDFVNE